MSLFYFLFINIFENNLTKSNKNNKCLFYINNDAILWKINKILKLLKILKFDIKINKNWEKRLTGLFILWLEKIIFRIKIGNNSWILLIFHVIFITLTNRVNFYIYNYWLIYN